MYDLKFLPLGEENMSHLNEETIRKLTELSCIECTKEEMDALLADMEKILKYFDELNALDTANVPACNHVLKDLVNVMREDTVKAPMPREVFLANAPEHTGGMIRVPLVITKTKAEDVEEMP